MRTPRISIFTSNPQSTSSSQPSMFAWLPWNRQYSPLPRSGSDQYANRASPTAARRKMMQIGVGAIVLLALIGVMGSSKDVRSRIAGTSSSPPSAPVIVMTTDKIDDPYWGKTEQQGWQPFNKEFSDLGQIAEERFWFGFSADEEGTRIYFERLHDFVSKLDQSLSKPMLLSLYNHLPNFLRSEAARPEEVDLGPPSMISYKTLHQTDKQFSMNDDMREWLRMNEKDGWKMDFKDDERAWEWVQQVFGGTDVEWAWSYMHRGVLRADFLRYLVPLVQGGVYSDVDTRPLRPIEQWGQINVETLDLSETDGPDWRDKQTTHPAVIVSIDVNVHNKMDWWQQWPRALDICQWTLSSAPNHPIFIDAARRVVNSTRYVEEWDMERANEIQRLETDQPEGWRARVADLKSQKKDHALVVMEWTGPGLFTDSVMGFLMARYKVSWHRLRGLSHPLRIGDVLVLPITGFSPGGEKDFHAEGWNSPQASVVHNCE